MPMFNPPHPGSVLREYLGGMLVTDAAKHLGITRVALSRILNGKAGISAEMALRLADALGTTAELWTGMQAQYDLWQASRKRRKRIARLSARLRTPPPSPLNASQNFVR
jgi:addiction module HigA family antidote